MLKLNDFVKLYASGLTELENLNYEKKKNYSSSNLYHAFTLRTVNSNMNFHKLP